ncbi:unnamed protein product [Oikopleura dioica]|uniref:Uncharacterized protein n=1 Tax=Oikopleura dioica TaxID=34765 RepID=E4Y6A6_OIKDI|nr:unnamed protein product [Oikopleura dioica]
MAPRLVLHSQTPPRRWVTQRIQNVSKRRLVAVTFCQRVTPKRQEKSHFSQNPPFPQFHTIRELERAKRGRGHDSVTRHSEIEDAKSAIRAYRGGKPKYEDSFFNWCKNNLRIDEEIISELWQWYHETELIEDEDDDISYEQDKNINSNQYRSIDEVKMALIAKAHSGVPRTKASFSNYLKCSMPKKVSKEWNHQLWNWAKKRYEL